MLECLQDDAIVSDVYPSIPIQRRHLCSERADESNVNSLSNASSACRLLSLKLPALKLTALKRVTKCTSYPMDLYTETEPAGKYTGRYIGRQAKGQTLWQAGSWWMGRRMDNSANFWHMVTIIFTIMASKTGLNVKCKCTGFSIQ